MTEDSGKEQFIYPKDSYRGEFNLENMAFNANLQEFAQKVNIVCNLETNGKITSNDAYKRIKKLWRELKSSRKSLKIQKKDDETSG
ncbi:hypothetical protein Lepto7376_2567 [[Leptolyngbya] sp. PCC 7376]|uniref:DUF7219 family protein n=1 Tax=[Leptolyngbya] sp. PCC 7376 TaxID=111781 RepID=UPI00029F0B52|nr:hypothetical protein [[Leptolyngbya] sp. PCC 7376]AFY38840.1 hypothetical protein Lepto7376_2567 [[Leptolyngbya] sp. PCC 7376]